LPGVGRSRRELIIPARCPIILLPASHLVSKVKKNKFATWLLLIVAYLGFLSLGLPDTLIGVAWPSVRDSFQLPQSAVALVFFGAGCSNFLSSFFTGKLLHTLGIGMLLAGSSALVAFSCFGYGLAPAWWLFAVWSLLHGLGSGAIDAGLNHYAAHRLSARHMNWLHAFYSLGATLGAFMMTAVLAANFDWRTGYLGVAAILLCLSLLFIATRGKWDDPCATASAQKPDSGSAGMAETLRQPAVWLQAALFFVYTGLEVSVGQWSFTLLTESRNVVQETAGAWVTVYWGSIGVGRILFGMFVERVGIDRLLRLSTLTTALGTVLIALDLGGPVTGLALALAGLGLAAIYPCMMSRTPKRLGKSFTSHAIGFQVSAATLGAAALPSLTGYLAERLGLETLSAAPVAMALILLLLHESLLLPSRKLSQ